MVPKNNKNDEKVQKNYPILLGHFLIFNFFLSFYFFHCCTSVCCGRRCLYRNIAGCFFSHEKDFVLSIVFLSSLRACLRQVGWNVDPRLRQSDRTLLDVADAPACFGVHEHRPMTSV